MVTKCHTAFKIVTLCLLVIFINLDILFHLIDPGRPTRVTRAKIITKEVQFPLYEIQDIMYSIAGITQFGAITIKQ